MLNNNLKKYFLTCRLTEKQHIKQDNVFEVLKEVSGCFVGIIIVATKLSVGARTGEVKNIS